MDKIFTILAFIGIFCALCYSNPFGAKAAAKEIFRDAVHHGAWLYEGNCVNCHGIYGKARVGEDYDGDEELAEAIVVGGCKHSWGRRAGGPLGREEIEALVRYISLWESLGKEPELPPLPPQPKTREIKKDKSPEQQKTELETTDKDPLSPPLRQLVEDNPIARGAWLYTGNCYRCHLGYDQARMGKGQEPDTVARIIREGKTSTQMTPFSQLLGGNLRNSEILTITDYIMAWERAGAPLAIARPLLQPPALDPIDFLPLRLPRFKTIQGEHQSGRALFIRSCAGCHGPQGEGYIGSDLKNGINSLRPDLYIKSVIKRGIANSPMPSFTTAPLRLSGREIDDLVGVLVTKKLE